MITYLEPNILECEVKWALGSITTNKVNGDDGLVAELLQILKDDAINVLHSIISANLGKPSRSHRTGKGQVSFQSQRKAMPKNVQRTPQLHSLHMLARSCSKSSMLSRLQQYVN